MAERWGHGSGAPGGPPCAELQRPLPELPTHVVWARAILVRPGQGVRAAASRDVQVVCDTGIYSLDALLQGDKGPGWVVLGQLFDKRDDQPAAEVDVVLHTDQRPVAVARTDAFGEFAFTNRPCRRLGVALHGAQLAHVELWRRD
jgi:hypothetical protein